MAPREKKLLVLYNEIRQIKPMPDLHHDNGDGGEEVEEGLAVLPAAGGGDASHDGEHHETKDVGVVL